MNIVSAGMHRSGSTWLFNALRMLFKSENVYSCFVPYDKSKLTDINIVKIHTFNKDLAKNFADYVFITKRDIRDIAASAVRRKLIALDENYIKDYLNKIIYAEFEQWKPYVNMIIPYEHLIIDKKKYIKKIANLLKQNVTAENIEKIYNDVENLNYKCKTFDPVTQLHPNHITNGGSMTFAKTLPVNIISMIENEFKPYINGPVFTVKKEELLVLKNNNGKINKK